MTDRPRLFQDSRDLLKALSDSEVEYLVVGAHAMAVHGVPRATLDFDVLVRPSAANAARVYAALVAFGAPLAAHGIQAGDFARPGLVYQMGLPPRRIDIITRIDGVHFDEAWAGRVESEVDGVALTVIGRRELLKNKKATGRRKDALDVALLERD